MNSKESEMPRATLTNRQAVQLIHILYREAMRKARGDVAKANKIMPQLLFRLGFRIETC